MNKNTFVDGILLNAVLIVAGVTFLVWMSTLSNSDIAAKMEFYGSSAGIFVGMSLFMIPFVFIFRKVSQGGFTGKRLAIWMAGMVLVQLVIAAYIPVIVEQYRGTGVNVGEIIIRSKE